ncbi:histidine phosphatase family protein [Hydrogenophaga sp.]|uniref:histidine phosphatase family protein n=1 Tax=Hydrogenophaga sp. TaxID=1904254 RepID=UPI00262D1849|nr:histidine phosphatase family protein [Hydrogenophaga sp.]MCW5652113.1 histidine phosphatase family protein [Hydrogenophaga sp.]
MRLILVRHGQPDEAHHERPGDPPLTDLGHAQSQAVGAFLAREGVTHVVSSPMLRARQTAEPLARQLAMQMHVFDGWAEVDQGTERYRSIDTIRAQGEVEWARFLDDPIGYFGVDPVVFRAGIRQAMASSMALAPSGVVAVFTHGMVINTLLSTALGLSKVSRFGIGHGSVTRLAAPSIDAIGVLSVNELGHQPTQTR